MAEDSPTVEDVIARWPADSGQALRAFTTLKDHLGGLHEVLTEFQARPGISYSLRGISQKNADDRPLFVMIDIIVDEPRWLSVCFYHDMISDPEERGDFVPGGLLGENGLCFDVEDDNQMLLDYVMARIDEARQAAGSV
jgi:hypothetical protein